MYSSLIDGIILDPALMVIPLDDHMVHRGHGVFDTAMLVNGCIYDLDSHLDRFIKSASKAKIPSPFSHRSLKKIILQLAASSKLREGSIRYWLSAGQGSFTVSFPTPPQSAFYAIIIDKKYNRKLKGAKVVTSSIPMKPPMFATMKSVNYLPNVLSQLEAEEKGAYASVWVDEDGFIAEGTCANIAIVSKCKELLLPLSEKIFGGCTSKRLSVLALKLVEKGVLKSVNVRRVAEAEARDSAEMMLVSSLTHVMPVVEWDDQPIGDGRVGELTVAIANLFWEDVTEGPEMLRTPVPYKELQIL
ncbi:uncharacterized protein A4U43_C01F30750 [Asparagus officinalis]|uniref:Uncharacterized protein n=1 Tax=Asparagus officinalis TaxID=4686 RepID=A0A5P1FWE3_ASPOF|nr:D-amino-acid transaminase, chloroplastic-like [Asparagus officinalis]ONK81579.1 uncharacterized protein A4U43_C01F30750 [Asparagus officinalis]